MKIVGDGRVRLGFVLMAGLLPWTASGQEALRMSLAGEAAAEGRNESASALQSSNLRFGHTLWTVGAGLGIQASDNVRLVGGTEAKADLLFRPNLNLRMLWPISDRNSINLAMGGGYSAYMANPEFNRWFITPGSELAFDVFVGDFWFNIHDRVSVTEDNYQDPTVVGSGSYSQLQNAVGLSAVWDLNRIVVRSGYDHVNYVTLQGNEASRPNVQSEVFLLSAAYSAAPGLSFGLESGGALISSDASTNAFSSDGTQWNVGAFTETKISEYLNLTARVGYTQYLPDEGSGSDTASDVGGIYGFASLRHTVNKYLDYTLSGGRTVTVALRGGTVDLTSADLQLNWHFFKETALSTGFRYEKGTQVGRGGESFTRFGPSISASRAMTAKLTASVRYQYYVRQSDTADRDYEVNVVDLNLNYQF